MVVIKYVSLNTSENQIIPLSSFTLSSTFDDISVPTGLSYVGIRVSDSSSDLNPLYQINVQENTTGSTAEISGFPGTYYYIFSGDADVTFLDGDQKDVFRLEDNEDASSDFNRYHNFSLFLRSKITFDFNLI